ncbi:unnamed protein product, partial [Staurois parvus]
MTAGTGSDIGSSGWTAGIGSPGISRHRVIWRWIVWLDSGHRITRHDRGHWVIRHWIVWLDSGHRVTRYDSGHWVTRHQAVGTGSSLTGS